MADALAPVNLFRRLVFILIAVVGLIFLIVGGWLLASQSWDRASGTVGRCETRVTHTQPGKASGRTEYLCEVTWRAGGTGHTSTVSMGNSSDAVPGNIVELRVDGDNAVLVTPVWVGVASAGLGTLLVVVAFVMMRRARKAV